MADLDVKPTAYSSVDEARADIEKMCVAIGLPLPSLYIGSGNGLHVYWRMVDPMTIDEWQLGSDKLKAAMQQHKIKADHGITVDAARILRPPGTKNYKDPANPKDVVILPSSEQSYSLQQFMGALTKIPNISLATVGGKAVASAPNSIYDQFTGGQQKAPPVDVRAIGQFCPTLGHEFATHGAATPEPLWALVAMACVFDEKPNETFHIASYAYPSYDINEAMTKLAAKQAAQARGAGWPSCQSFATNGGVHCATCPHLPAGKSPLNLMHLVHQAQAQAQAAQAQANPGTYTPPPGMLHPKFLPYRGDAIAGRPHPFGLHRQEDGHRRRLQASAVPRARGRHRPRDGRAGLPCRRRPSRRQVDPHSPQRRVGPRGRLRPGQPVRNRLRARRPTDREFFHGMDQLTCNPWAAALTSRRPNSAGDPRTASPSTTSNGSTDSHSPATSGPTLADYGVEGTDAPWRALMGHLNVQNNPGLNCIAASAFASPLAPLVGVQASLFST